MAAEGDQYITSTITPTFAGNRLLIELVMSGGESTNVGHTVALFQDSTASAIAAVPGVNGATSPNSLVDTLRHEMAAGTTSATTFKVRAGLDSAGTYTFNGENSARLYGGVIASSLRVTEIFI